ncbi:MAG: cupin domain-containing protein [Gammaproteobacteria bacterium]|nr:cupin domain-containing protein [Gammaproteobacteria bacterium]
MSIDQDMNLVIAGTDGSGKPCFLDRGQAQVYSEPGVVDVAFLWNCPGTPHLPHQIGGAPSSIALPGPGGSACGIVRFPPNSAGRLDAKALLTDSAEAATPDDAAMHSHDTIDYEIVLSGKIDIVLQGNQRRTLKVGDILVMGGLPHAWENVYDEPCTYAFVTVGATGKTAWLK